MLRSALSSVSRRQLALSGHRPAVSSVAQAKLFLLRPNLAIEFRRRVNLGTPSSNQNPDPTQGDSDARSTGNAGKEEPQGDAGFKGTAFKMFESAMTTFASITILGLAGWSYTRYYKYMVLQKMEHAFQPGDPVLDLAKGTKSPPPTIPPSMYDGEDPNHGHWIPRLEQQRIDAIVSGAERGHYLLVIGEKGTGKSSMLIDAMAKVNGEGIAMFDAHADLEIFRIRLGKALDFEFHEDNVGSLFSIRGPRDASALLDIERAFNKLEKVALKRRKEVGRPLVLIVNNVHLLRDDDDGKDLVELIQQRAEQWAASNLATVIFNSDDYWIWERLKHYATRMEVIAIRDLPRDQALRALHNYRKRYYGEDTPASVLDHVYRQVGGRLSYLSRVAKSPDMAKMCERICAMEKTWFLNQCWILGEEMDDDVMDQQKYASAAMVLAKALVDKEKELETVYDDVKGHVLPQVPLHEARQIMTRADFIQAFDHINIFTIDSTAMVRADSVPMQIAFREVCSQKGFNEHLEATLERISAIESLGRTRELTIKDLWNGGKYKVTTKNAKGYVDKDITFETVAAKEEDDDKK